MTAPRRSLRGRFAIIFSGLMGVILLVVTGTLIFVRVRDQKELLERYALSFAKSTAGPLGSAHRLYYRSGAY